VVERESRLNLTLVLVLIAGHNAISMRENQSVTWAPNLPPCGIALVPTFGGGELGTWRRLLTVTTICRMMFCVN
jgi:hypothetical protein